jgi:hypothetical protein
VVPPNPRGRTPLVRAPLLLRCLRGPALAALALLGCPAGERDATPATGHLDPALERELEQMVALGYVQGSEEATPETGSGVTHHEPALAWPGLNFAVSAHAPEARLLDMEGRELHRWARSYEETWPGRPLTKRGARHHRYWRRALPLPDGSLLAVFENLGLVKLDRDSKLLWTYPEATHHDVAAAPDGNLYVLIRVPRRIPSINVFRPVFEDFVAILDADGRERRRVSLFEALRTSPWAGWLDTARESPSEDIFHTNTVEWLDGRQAHVLPAFREGNLLVSLHALHGIAVLDPEQERIVWGMRGEWRLQHEPRVLENGHVLLFDNTGAGERSRVLEIEPRSGEVVWRYEPLGEPVFFTLCCGTSQRLPNGNTLITETQRGRAVEVDRTGRSVWEYRNPHRTGERGETVANLFELLRLPADFGAR